MNDKTIAILFAVVGISLSTGGTLLFAHAWEAGRLIPMFVAAFLYSFGISAFGGSMGIVKARIPVLVAPLTIFQMLLAIPAIVVACVLTYASLNVKSLLGFLGGGYLLTLGILALASPLEQN